MKIIGKPLRKKGIYLLLTVVPLVFMMACAGGINPDPPPRPDMTSLPPVSPPRPTKALEAPAVALPPLAQLKPQVAEEEAMPFDSKVFSLSARSAPLQDVVMGLAKEAELNLVLEKGVDPITPVSIEINNLDLRTALDLLFSAYDYFYEISGNVLRVKALETRFFKFEYPLFYNTGESSVGGDVLGGGGGNSGLSGEFSVSNESDDDNLDVWKQIKSALSAEEDSGTGGGLTGDTAGGGGASGEDGEAGLLSANGKARVDAMTGTIVVTDTRERLAVVEKYLAELEKSLKRQVVIEARIMEVSLNDNFQFGIDWTYLSGDVTFTQTLAAGVGALNLGIIPTGGDGSTWFLDALSTQGEVNVLSAPRLNVLNNQSAVITVGRTLPYLEWEVEPATETTASRAVPTVSTANAGVSLGVTPTIGQDGVVTMHIVPIITDQTGEQAFTFEGNTFTVPIIDVRGSDTIIQAPNGSTVIMAGMMQEQHGDTTTGIPFLKDIPLLGALFSQQARTMEKVELVITLTPTIVEP